MSTVGQQGVHDPGQQADEPDREGGVANPVDLGHDAHTVVLETPVTPYGCNQPDGYRFQEHQPPFDRGQHPTKNQTQERAAHCADPVDTHRPTTLI